MYNDVNVDNELKKGAPGSASTSASAGVGPYAGKAEAELWDRFFGDWIWRAVECLIDIKDFNPSPRWISNRLGISVEQAVDAIDGLLALNRIMRDQEGGYVKNPEAPQGKKTYAEGEFNKLITDYFIMSNQINSRIKVEKYNDVYMNQVIMSGSRKDVDEFVKKIKSAVDELREKGTIEADDIDVFGMTIGVVSLTEAQDEA